MERRSKSKANFKESQKNVQATQNKSKYNDIEKRTKESLMFSLTEVFHQSRNEPSLIHPWMKEFHQLEERIIGMNYMIVGPSQSGKYSAVKFALGEYYPDVQQILVNCEVSTTQHQFLVKLLDEFRDKAPKCKWPHDDKEINKLITNEKIDFSSLNPYIQKGNLKFVIIIRNGDHLAGFRKQVILYSLFEWMATEVIRKRGGLVILTRQLCLIDRFEKRIRSRFCGNRLCIFRPQDPDIYIQVIKKRIEAVIKDKQTWIKLQQLQNNSMDNQNQPHNNSDEQTNTRIRAKVKKGQKPKVSHKISQLNKILDKFADYKYIIDLNQYDQTLKCYLPTEMIREAGVEDYFLDKLAQFQKCKNKKQLKFFPQQSSLSPNEQIQCLYKLKQAIEKNKEMSLFFGKKILQFRIISIPFVLRIFQHIFLTLEETVIKYLDVEQLKILILKLLEKNVEFEFPINVMESNCLQNFNNVELLLLILIYEMILRGKNSIKLTIIHNEYRTILHRQIHHNTDRTSSKIPLLLLERSIQRLHRSQVISIDLNNIWNSEINLLLQTKKIKIGLQHLAKTRKLPQILQEKLQEINIAKKSGSSQVLHVNLTMSS